MSQSEHVQTVRVEANRETPTRATVEARGFELTIDEPEAMGGTDQGPTPLEYLLASQAGCLNVTGTLVATDMGIDIEDLEIAIEGDFDQGTFQTERPDDRTGLQDIEVTMSVSADADRETHQEWAERVEERCPVSDTIRNETSVSLAIE